MFYVKMKLVTFTGENLSTLSTAAFSAFEHAPTTDALLRNKTAKLFLLEDEGAYAAYALVYSFPSNDYLEFLEVAPPWRGKDTQNGKASQQILSAVFRSTLESSGCLVISRHTEKGKRSLLPLEEELRKTYPSLDVVYDPGV